MNATSRPPRTSRAGPRARVRHVAVLAAFAAALATLGCGPPPSPGTTPPSPTPTGASTPTPTRPALWIASGARTPPARRWWAPAQGATWQIQYAGRLDLTAPAPVYDVDVDDTSAAQVAALHAVGRRVICYLNAGAWESYRADQAAFPATVLGARMDGWPQERWLDIRRLDVLMPIMTARLQRCRAKGFDAVDPDNIDGWAQATGFPLTKADSRRYVEALAAEAHRLGLGFGLKNGLELVSELQAVVDFAVNEQCVQYKECGWYDGFVAAGKAVLHIEYAGSLATVCRSRPAQFSTLIKDLDLTAARQACPN